ncbi:MAG: hypothetical protein CL609_10085 [Anaerolineaceae bacterium]|nr:hypothetical protein [Anaerolineaceae bacterium]
MNTELFVKKNRIGSIAYQWLSKNQQAEVFGTTSGGIFIHLLTGYQTIYLTNYPDFGPININLVNPIPKQWEKGKKLEIRFDEGMLFFQNGLNELSFSEFKIWQNQPSLPLTITAEEFLIRVKKTSQQLFLIKGDHGFTSLLPKVYSDGASEVESSLTQVWQQIQGLKKSLFQKDIHSFLSNAKNLISYGRGLTPSGDDFLCGLIYCLRRKDRFLQYQQFLDLIQPEIIRMASEQTTSISTSLLYGCFLGEAHSRIENMTDALTNSESAFTNQALRMAGWGSSSGADTTLGIVIACQVLLNLSEGTK